MADNILFSTGCPKCNILKMKLDEAGIDYTISDDVDKLIELGFRSAPVLEVKGEYYDFGDAVSWIRGQVN